MFDLLRLAFGNSLSIFYPPRTQLWDFTGYVVVIVSIDLLSYENKPCRSIVCLIEFECCG